MKMKVCTMCKKEKPLDMFYPDRTKKIGLMARCKDCQRELGYRRRSLRDPEYGVWAQMRARCNSKNHPRYSDHGGRGIKICTRWDSYKLFISDMGRRPEGRYSIERINNYGDYNPSNCRWATGFEQQRNTRANVWLTYRGKTMIMKDWAVEFNIGYSVFRDRLIKGWGVEKALETPVARSGITK